MSTRTVSAPFEPDELAQLAVLCAAYEATERGQSFDARLIHHCVRLNVAELEAEHRARLAQRGEPTA